MLNKCPVLDKGFVATLNISLCDRRLAEIAQELKIDKSKLLPLASAAFVIKAPLFILINLAAADIKTVIGGNDGMEVYIPDISEIGVDDLSDKKAMAYHLKTTTEALLLSIKGLIIDGCDRFVAQTIAPVSTYATFIASASVPVWQEFCKQKTNHWQLEQYRAAIAGIMDVEWTTKESNCEAIEPQGKEGQSTTTKET